MTNPDKSKRKRRKRLRMVIFLKMEVIQMDKKITEFRNQMYAN